MKTNLIMAAIFTFGSVTSFAQGTQTGGGEAVAMRFAKYYRFAVGAIKYSVELPIENSFTREEYTKIKTVADTQVFAVDENVLCQSFQNVISGESIRSCKEAFYDETKKMILVNSVAWPKLPCLDKLSIVLHEYGRAAGLERADYSFSTKVYANHAMDHVCSQMWLDEVVKP